MNAAISFALLHSIWQCALIAFVLAVLMLVARGPKARYGLACIALIAMPLVFGITLWRQLPDAPTDIGVRFAVPWTTVIPESTESFQVPVSAPLNLVWLWFIGAMAVCIYRLAGWVSAQRLRHRGVCSASPKWQSRMLELSRLIGLNRKVRLLESALVEVPLTIGFLRPVILLPLGLLVGLPAQQAEAILLHELAHIARYDYLVNLMQASVEALLFYHPAVWWVSHVMRRERELCCDDEVIVVTGDPVTYAKALGTLEHRRAEQLVLAAGGGPLMQRIYRVMGKTVTRRASTFPALMFLILGSAAALFAFYPEPAPLPEPTPAPVPMPAPSPQQVAQSAPQPTAPKAQAVPDWSIPVELPPVVPTPDATVLDERVRRMAEAQLRRELETPYTNWLNQEVVWIISDAERSAFNRLQTDDERQMFIEQFWLRRDPTPDTLENEYKEEHYRRIAWANDQFRTAIPGWKTDRGMIYVKFGPPDEKEQHPTVEGTTFPYEKWRYRAIEGLGDDVTLEFVDPSLTNEYRLTWNPEEKNALLHVPGAGLTLYEQMGFTGVFNVGAGSLTGTPQNNTFDSLRRYMNVQRRPTK